MKTRISSLAKRSLLLGVFILTLAAGGYSQDRIVGGDDTTPGAYPWMVALVYNGSTDLYAGQFCGGSLIDQNWVLTAAHCVDGRSPSFLEIWAGVWDLDNPGSAQRRDVKAIYVHPGYKREKGGHLVNDIAFLLLDSPITTITPVAYATSPNAVTSGDSVRAIGWGDTEVTGARYPSILQQVDLTIRPISTARQLLGTNVLDSSHLAAGGNSRDTCQGDSGGPLFDLDGGPGNTPLLVGITSYGLGCAEGYPGIYTNVGYFSSLISAFLSQPTTGDPAAQVSGSGIVIPNGTAGVSRANGTKFKGKVRGGKKRSKSFLISNTSSGIPMNVDVVAKGSAFSVKKEPGYVFSSRAAVFRIEFTAPRRTRRNKCRVIVYTNDPNNRVYTFRLQAKSKYKRRRLPTGFGF